MFLAQWRQKADVHARIRLTFDSANFELMHRGEGHASYLSALDQIDGGYFSLSMSDVSCWAATAFSSDALAASVMVALG
jgi:hypothetical protein